MGEFTDIVRQRETATPLGLSGVFTGPSRDATDHQRFALTVYADQGGNLFTEQSADGVTWRRSAATAVAAGVVSTVTVLCVLRYVRVRYENGAIAQGTFEVDSALLEN